MMAVYKRRCSRAVLVARVILISGYLSKELAMDSHVFSSLLPNLTISNWSALRNTFVTICSMTDTHYPGQKEAILNQLRASRGAGSTVSLSAPVCAVRGTLPIACPTFSPHQQGHCARQAVHAIKVRSPISLCAPGNSSACFSSDHDGSPST